MPLKHPFLSNLERVIRLNAQINGLYALEKRCASLSKGG